MTIEELLKNGKNGLLKVGPDGFEDFSMTVRYGEAILCVRVNDEKTWAWLRPLLGEFI